MDNLIKETEVIARKYFLEFGFDETSIDDLLGILKIDLEKELHKLQHLLNTPNPDIEKINNSLHALKGLFFQAGHHKISEEINEIRSHINKEVAIQETRTLLGL